MAEPPALDLQAARPVTPTEPRLGALAGAGVGLARITLWVMAGVLAFLIGTFVFQETTFSRLTADAYRDAIGQAAQREARALSTRDAALAALLDAASNPGTGAAHTALRDAAAALHALAPDGEAGAALRALAGELHDDTPPEALRAAARRAALLLPTPGAQARQQQQELLHAYLDAINSTREFWARIAQLILLNLLLPVLTALLGYVFGSSQLPR
ncbi:hypothetical protein GALL_357720 [mine drainage metagenome]|uniref:Uncharacterized protein n=1 Tax=mine drainage metagenome TaxID=410659 RepID=A0A1J5QRC5_9ZZZZ